MSFVFGIDVQIIWLMCCRSLLYEVIKVKLQQYIENKSKLGAADEYLKVGVVS